MVVALALAACGPKEKMAFGIEDAFIRATPMKMTAGYALITNNTAEDDALTGVTADWAGKFELHTVTKDKDDVLSMTPVESIALPKGETIALRSGGLHIMIFDVAAPLEVSETRDAMLHFQHAKPQKITFKVKPITYKGVGSDVDEHSGH